VPEKKQRVSRAGKKRVQPPFDLACGRIERVSSSSMGVLDLQRLGLARLPDKWDALRSVRVVELQHNSLTSLSAKIGQLKDLTALDLSDNRLTSLPPEIGKLVNLTTLSLQGNQLTALPPEIGKLTKLTALSLRGNRLTALPPEMGMLTNLTSLDLGRNQLTVIPAEIGALSNLTVLDLSVNQLRTLPAELGRLAKLSTLDLTGNVLSVLPDTVRDCQKLKKLFLHSNPALAIPDEVLGPTETESRHLATEPKPPEDILAYYFRIHPTRVRPPQGVGTGARGLTAGRWVTSDKSKPLLEARIIVIGDGEAGKTSLVRALLYGATAREDEETTRDVVIEDWPHLRLRQPNTKRTHLASVHVWDFGGQEPLHAAHPYFFTTRTLYLVVASSRQQGVEERIGYWLKMVASHGKGARALVAINKVDQHPMDITGRRLCAEHEACLPADPAAAFFPTSCKAGKVSGIEALRQALRRELQAMDQIWRLVPAEWMAVKSDLLDRRANDEDTLTTEQWENVCGEHGIGGRDQAMTLDLLRALGTVVSFPEDDQLCGLGVLNPSWVTRAVYPLLTSSELAEAGGLLQRRDLARLLCDPKRYPRHKHGWLIELMKKFELLFESEGRLLLPSRLPKDVPVWALDPRWTVHGTLKLQMRFQVLPESVISKLIVRWHEHAWKPESWWRHGIAVKDPTERCIGLLAAYLGAPGYIELLLQGPRMERQQFVASLRASLQDVARNLQGELWLLLGGEHPEKYDDLLRLAHEGGERRIKRIVEGDMRVYDLAAALDLIEPVAQQQKTLTQVNIVAGDAKGCALGTRNRVKSRDSFRRTTP